jgi:hypothetical protein
MIESRAPMLNRAAALIAGLAVLIGAAVVSLGVALIVPLGVWVGHRVQRSRGRPFGTLGSWISAVSAVLIALVLIAGVMVSRVPAGTWDRIRHAADSASVQAAKQPPPAWLDRIAPGATNYSMSRPNNVSAFNAFTLILGGGIALSIFGNVIGTLGWIGTMLLVFSGSGRWLRDAPGTAIESDVT